MQESNNYIYLWRKYKTKIVIMMKEAVVEQQSYSLSKHEFTEIGDRKDSGYEFNLKLKDGKLFNSVNSTALVRDLVYIIKESAAAKELMKSNYYTLVLDKKFDLHINCQKIE